MAVTCEKCGVCLISEEALSRHASIRHVPEMVLTCPTCSVNFINKGSFVSHQKTCVLKQSEKEIQNQILTWLFYSHIFCWRNHSVGIWDASKGRYRRKNSPFERLGVSDILGVYKGRAFAIEVKSAKGAVSEVQKTFIHDFNEAGGVGFVARSLEDVQYAFSAKF